MAGSDTGGQGMARRPILLLATTFVVAALVAGCTRAYDDLPVDTATGILNFAKVSDGLYRGGQPDAQGFARLKAMGVRTVVSLRTLDVDRPLLEGLGLQYHHISFKAGHPEDEDVVTFLKVAEDPANRPVFIHCRWGCDRSGMMVAIYRVAVNGWSREHAIDEVQRMGFNEDWWNLRRYVQQLDVGALRQQLAMAPPPEVDVVP